MSDDHAASVAELVEATMKDMTPAQRVNLFVALFDSYCRDCGEPHPPGRVCTCRRDD